MTKFCYSLKIVSCYFVQHERKQTNIYDEILVRDRIFTSYLINMRFKDFMK